MAKRESGANGSRTRGFMLAPPYAQAKEMQGGGGRLSRQDHLDAAIPGAARGVILAVGGLIWCDRPGFALARHAEGALAHPDLAREPVGNGTRPLFGQALVIG